MSDKKIKNTINPEDIETKDVERRKFLMGSAGTIIATSVAAASMTGCATSDPCDSNVADPAYYDNDGFNGLQADSNVTNSCDAD